MAESIGVFGDYCGSKLYRNLELYQRGGRSKKDSPVDLNALFQTLDEWGAFNKEDFFENNPKLTEKQQWLLDVRGQY